MKANQQLGLTDLLQFAYVAGDGLIINKDGALLTTYQFRGPDLSSATGAELDALTQTFNRMLTFLEDGWMLHMDVLRVPSVDYASQGYFPSKVAALIDDERRAYYEAQGHHFENMQLLTFVWKFPIPVVTPKQRWFVKGLPSQQEHTLNQWVQLFQEKVSRCVSLLQAQIELSPLTTTDLLAFLNTCITGELLPIAMPPADCSLDGVLARQPLTGGYCPKIGDSHIMTLSLLGYVNDATVPGILEHLNTYPAVYRWSNRFIALSEATAQKEIKRYERHWHNQIKGFSGIIKEAFLGRVTEQVNHAAAALVEQAEAAGLCNANHSTRFGYWTSTVVLMHTDPQILEDAYLSLRQYVEQAGFACKKEDINALEAWLGSIPGHGSYNVRRMLVSGFNVAHALPLTSIWVGDTSNHKASLLPKDAPPVFYAATTGATPFRFHLDVADVGHQLVLGPIGAGKSTWLGLLIAQFLRYQRAQIFVFDKDYSHLALTRALGGEHYDIGKSAELAFCPLADLSSDNQCARAGQWLEMLVELQGITLTPIKRQAIQTALQMLAVADKSHRNLSVLTGLVQEREVREALQFYTQSGGCQLLDATTDTLSAGYLHTFEMGELLAQKQTIAIPVLHYLFNHIEKQLEEQQSNHPTLIILEEAWLYLQHDTFANKLRDWLKTLRKKNARVIFATQSLADLYDPATKSLTAVTATLLESCPTKVFLPNLAIDTEMKALYQNLGLNERQLEIIQHIALPKRHYYVTTPQGQRLIELGLEALPLARAFIGLSKAQSARLIKSLQDQPDTWIEHWLSQQNLTLSEETKKRDVVA